MSYDLTNFNASMTNWSSFTVNLNEQTSYWFGTLVVVVLWVALYVSFKKEDSVSEFLLPSFITSIVGSLMFFIGLIHWGVLLLPIVGVIVSLMMMFFQ